MVLSVWFRRPNYLNDYKTLSSNCFTLLKKFIKPSCSTRCTFLAWMFGFAVDVDDWPRSIVHEYVRLGLLYIIHFLSPIIIFHKKSFVAWQACTKTISNAVFGNFTRYPLLYFFWSHAMLISKLLFKFPTAPRVLLMSVTDFYSIILANHWPIFTMLQNVTQIKITSFKLSKPIFASIVRHNIFIKEQIDLHVLAAFFLC